jgi:hypothetical protein
VTIPAKSMHDLREVVVYLAQRVGLIPGRVWFGAGMAGESAAGANAKKRRSRSSPALS